MNVCVLIYVFECFHVLIYKYVCMYVLYIFR